MRCGFVRLVGLVIAFGWPMAAHGAPTAAEEQPLRLEYEAHAGCPDALSFFWHVRARTQRVRLAEPNELALLASVHITVDGSESVGRLELPGPEPEGQSFVREVRASSCEEVVLALSLVLALAYDPDAVQTFSQPAPPPPVAEPPPAPPPPPPIAPPPRPERSLWRAAFGVQGHLLGGVVASSLEPAGSAFVEVGHSDGLFSPTLTASFVFAPSESGISDIDPTARIRYLGGRLSLCPIQVAIMTRLELAPCVGLDVGRLYGSTEVRDSLGEQGKTWSAALFAARLRWNFSERFFGETSAGFGVTLTSRPDGFVLEGRSGEESVFDVPRVVSDFGLGLGVYFP